MNEKTVNNQIVYCPLMFSLLHASRGRCYKTSLKQNLIWFNARTQKNWSLLATHDRLFAKKEKRNTLVQRMSQRHKLDSKASGEMKVKSFER